jgi:hypothetical protein
MSLSLAFQLRVEERGDKRVVVSVLLAPDGEAQARIEGVALQLYSRTGEALGAQMLLPIAGALTQPMLSTIELKAPEPIPLGSKVVGTAWHGAEQREASIPTDPFTEFEVHMCARRRILPSAGSAEDLERLVPEERARIARDYPWIDEPRVPRIAAAELAVVDSEEADGGEIDDLVDHLGLDEESSDWLRELLQEE